MRKRAISRRYERGTIGQTGFGRRYVSTITSNVSVPGGNGVMKMSRTRGLRGTRSHPLCFLDHPEQDVELNGKAIPSGDLVLAMVGSANRDPRQFRDPHRFDVTRAAASHVGFGHGIHFCIGAALARLEARVEARVALSALLHRVPHIERADRGSWLPRSGLNVHGPRGLALRLRDGRVAVAVESTNHG